MSLSHHLLLGLVVFLTGCMTNQTPPSSPTPLPVSTVTPTAPPISLAPTLTPTLVIPPSPGTGPTALPPTPGLDPDAQQARTTLTLTSSATTVRSGETITLTGVLSGMGLPQYTLYLEDEAAVIVRYDNQVVFQGFTGEQVEFVSAAATGSEAQFVLRAIQPGAAQVALSASGEVAVGGGQGQPPVWAWGNAASDNLIVQIER